MGNCCSDEGRAAKERNDRIDKILTRDKKNARRELKLLLLGQYKFWSYHDLFNTILVMITFDKEIVGG